MKKVCAVAAMALLFSAGVAMAADQKQMTVTVKQTEVRATPGYLGKIVGVLVYLDKVTVLDQPTNAPTGWLKISGPGGKIQGWVNISAVTSKDVALKSGTTAAQSASSGDVALAGKGFNADVEAQYKQDQKLDYTWVDTMEAYQVSPQTVSLFLSQGGLSEQGGAQ